MFSKILTRTIPRTKYPLRIPCIKRNYSTEINSTEINPSDLISKPDEINPEELKSVDLSPEIEQELNEEFAKFIKDFAIDYDFLYERIDLLKKPSFDATSAYSTHLNRATSTKPVIGPDGNAKGQTEFPNVVASEPTAPYTTQELYLRRLFHAKSTASGSIVKDTYKPHEDLTNPPSIRDTSLATLVAAGAHLGHSTSLFRESNQPFIYGIRDGIHIIDLDQTLTRLRQASKVAYGISNKGGVILFVGTLPGQERIVESAANRAHGFYVHTRWIPGTLTNATQLSAAWSRIELDMGDQPTGRQLSQSLKQTVVKPDLVVILNPVENRNLINECRLGRIPTVGIIDTNSESTLVSYAIPANDDSLRTASLIAGILSRAAQQGRNDRLRAFKETEGSRAEEKERLKKIEESEAEERERLKGIKESEAEENDEDIDEEWEEEARR